MSRRSSLTKELDNLNRWLERSGFGAYAAHLNRLDINTLEHLQNLQHPQLIELARQLGMRPVVAVMFAESVVELPTYLHRNTIDEHGDVALAYQLVHLISRLKELGPRDNWDMATDDIYQLIDSCADQRELMRHVEDILQIDRENYVAWDLCGLLHARRGYLADARVCFQRSLVKHPNYLHARFNHARLLHYELNEFDKAQREYECIIRLRPNFSRANNSYAKLLERLNQFQKAEKYFRLAVSLRPKSVSYRHNLASILSRQSRNMEVQQVYQEAVTHHPRSASLRYHHALALVKCRFYKEAELEFQNALKLNPENPQIYHDFAKFCERQRNPPAYDKATQLYFKAFQLDPVNFLDAAVDVANLMRRLDSDSSRQSAEQLFSFLVDKAPHLDQAFLGYCKLLEREERFDEAATILKKGMQQHPNNASLKQYHAHFAKFRQASHEPKTSGKSAQEQKTGGNHVTMVLPNLDGLDQLDVQPSKPKDSKINENGSRVSLTLSDITGQLQRIHPALLAEAAENQRESYRNKQTRSARSSKRYSSTKLSKKSEKNLDSSNNARFLNDDIQKRVERQKDKIHSNIRHEKTGSMILTNPAKSALGKSVSNSNSNSHSNANDDIAKAKSDTKPDETQITEKTSKKTDSNSKSRKIGGTDDDNGCRVM